MRRPSGGGEKTPGAGLLALATLVAAATFSLALPTGPAIDCDRLPALGVLAALAAVLLALCFRGLATAGKRSLLGASLLLAAASLFAGTAFLVRYRAVCGQLQEQLRQQQPHH
ncbi:MAG TPA: hypothetical protein VGD62_04770 [Acidobacteriaceae bacterium]